jgi:hypothetical protein
LYEGAVGHDGSQRPKVLVGRASSAEKLVALRDQPVVGRAWEAILARTGPDGRLVDVCESTGTRGLSFDDCLRRRAILGRDLEAAPRR